MVIKEGCVSDTRSSSTVRETECSGKIALAMCKVVDDILIVAPRETIEAFHKELSEKFNVGRIIIVYDLRCTASSPPFFIWEYFGNWRWKFSVQQSEAVPEKCCFSKLVIFQIGSHFQFPCLPRNPSLQIFPISKISHISRTAVF